MESVEEIAIQTYQNNINYFSRQHPQLYKLINSFSQMLENGMYTQQYDLEYINNYFDIKELSSDKYIYNENSNRFSQKIADNISFKKNEAVFNNIGMEKSSNEFLANLNERNRGNEGIYYLKNYIIDNSSKNDSMNRIEKFIFIGIGLGQHIELIDKKIKSKEYLLIEDNLEFFRLSLFVTKYYEIGKDSKIHFCIAEDEYIFARSMQKFIESNFVYNKLFKYTHLKTHSYDKIKRIQNSVISQDFLTFPYGLHIEKNLRALEFINSGYNILNLTEHFTDTLLTDMPVLLLAAGPSFEKNIEWLKENHHNFVIVCASAVLKRLYDINVKPDIVTHIDGLGASTLYFQGFDVKTFLEDTIFIFESFTPALIREMFPKESVFQFEGDTYYSNKKKSISTPCVGTLSVLISLLLNTKELYLLGLDLAVDQKTGQTHSDKHRYHDKTDIDNKKSFSSKMGLRKTFISVEGNLEELVYTTPLFNASIQAIYNNIENIKSDTQQIYNLSDGAKLRSAKGIKIADIGMHSYKKVDKQKLYSSLLQLLLTHSIKKIDDDSEKSMGKRYKYILDLKKELDLCFKNISYVDSDKYMNNLVSLLYSILKENSLKSSNIREVYYKYFLYMFPIVIDFFNIKGLKNKKRHIKKIDAIVKKTIYEIQSTYEGAIGNFIEREKVEYALKIKHIIETNEYLDNNSLATLTCSYDQDLSSTYKQHFEFKTIKEAKSGELLEILREYTNNISIYKESLFKDNLKRAQTQEKIEKRSRKNNIGFLAVKENIEDIEFINYIKELLIRFPEVKLKYICFHEVIDSQIQILFLDFKNRIQKIIPEDLYTLSQEIDILISTHNSIYDYNIFEKTRLNCNIITIHHNISVNTLSINDAIAIHKKRSHPIINNPNYFGYSEEELADKGYSIHKLLYEDFLNIDNLNENLYEFVYFRLFSELLKNINLQAFYIAHQRKEIEYSLEKRFGKNEK